MFQQSLKKKKVFNGVAAVMWICQTQSQGLGGCLRQHLPPLQASEGSGAGQAGHAMALPSLHRPRGRSPKGLYPSDLSLTSTWSYRAHPPRYNSQQILPAGHREAGNQGWLDQAFLQLRSSAWYGCGRGWWSAEALRHLLPIWGKELYKLLIDPPLGGLLRLFCFCSQIRFPTEMSIVQVKNIMPPQKAHTSEIHMLIWSLCSFQPNPQMKMCSDLSLRQDINQFITCRYQRGIAQLLPGQDCCPKHRVGWRKGRPNIIQIIQI